MEIKSNGGHPCFLFPLSLFGKLKISALWITLAKIDPSSSSSPSTSVLRPPPFDKVNIESTSAPCFLQSVCSSPYAADQGACAFLILEKDKFLDLWTEKRKKMLEMSELGVSSDKKRGKETEDVRARG
jgi:hypothetical protein